MHRSYSIQPHGHLFIPSGDESVRAVRARWLPSPPHHPRGRHEAHSRRPGRRSRGALARPVTKRHPVRSLERHERRLRFRESAESAALSRTTPARAQIQRQVPVQRLPVQRHGGRVGVHQPHQRVEVRDHLTFEYTRAPIHMLTPSHVCLPKSSPNPCSPLIPLPSPLTIVLSYHRYELIVQHMRQRLAEAGASGGPWAFPIGKSVYSTLEAEICEQEWQTGFIEPVRTNAPPPPSPTPGPPPPPWKPCMDSLRQHCPCNHFKTAPPCEACGAAWCNRSITIFKYCTQKKELKCGLPNKTSAMPVMGYA